MMLKPAVSIVLLLSYLEIYIESLFPWKLSKKKLNEANVLTIGLIYSLTHSNSFV